MCECVTVVKNNSELIPILKAKHLERIDPFFDVSYDESVLYTLEQRHGCPVWVTKTGEYIPVSLMNPHHAANIRRLTKKALYNAEVSCPVIGSLYDEDDMTNEEAMYFHEKIEPKMKAWIEVMTLVLKYHGFE